MIGAPEGPYKNRNPLRYKDYNRLHQVIVRAHTNNFSLSVSFRHITMFVDTQVNRSVGESTLPLRC